MIELMMRMLELIKIEDINDREIAILKGMYKLPKTYEDGKLQPEFKILNDRLLIRERP